MFIQTENTPNPNSLKFLPGRKVSNNGPLEILNQEDTNNLLIKNLLQINGVTGVFLGEDFFSINKEENKNETIFDEDLYEYYLSGSEKSLTNLKQIQGQFFVFSIKSFNYLNNNGYILIR